jgi:hypothetical protein
VVDLNRLLFKAIAYKINANGGITLDQKCEEVKKGTGYFVSLVGVKRLLPNRCEEYKTAIVSSHDVEVCLKDLTKYGLLCLIGYVGFWKDDCDLYADITLHISSKRLAILIGKVFQQKAIFDCEYKVTRHL